MPNSVQILCWLELNMAAGAWAQEDNCLLVIRGNAHVCLTHSVCSRPAMMHAGAASALLAACQPATKEPIGCMRQGGM